MRKLVITVLLAGLAALTLNGQNRAQTYFADGYHGGVYGHYPAGYTGKIVAGLDSFPEWKIGLEIEPVTWDLTAIQEPTAYRRFRDYLMDGTRVEYTNPAFGQPYMYNISGESIIRQFQIGIDVLHRHFPGLKPETYCVAEPCFTTALPAVLSSLGFRYCTTKCPDTIFGGWFSPHDAELEWWVGPDGESRILNSPRFLSATLDPYCAWSSSDHSMTRAYVDASFAEGIKHPIGMTYQDAGWRIVPWLDIRPEEEGEFVSAPDYAEPQYILWKQYFARMLPTLDIKRYSYSQEDMHPSLVWGAQTLQRISRMVRHLETRTVQTEKLCTMSALTGPYDYPQRDIRLSWEGLLLSQHHDCWICSPWWIHRAEEWVNNSEAYLDKAAESAIEQHEYGDAVTVYNTTGQSRRDRVTVPADERFNSVIDARYHRIPAQRTGDSLVFMAEIPAFGWTSFTLSADVVRHSGGVTAGRKRGKIIMSNDIYDITFDPSRGGAMVSVWDRRSMRELIDKQSTYPFNGLNAFYPEEGKYHKSDESPAEVKVVCCGEVYGTVQIYGEINGTGFIQTVTLTAGSPVIECSLTLHWKGPSAPIGDYEPADGDQYDESGNRMTWNMPFYDSGKKMNLTFPTPGKGRVVKNAPFDVCESRLDDTFFSRFDSLKHNVILNWVDLESSGGNLALFSDHTTSYAYGPDFPLGLTVQYIGSGHGRAVHNVECPSSIDYALVFHSGGWDTDGIHTFCDRWCERLIPAAGRKPAAENSLLSLDGTGYQLVTAYYEGDDLYVRLFNASGDDTVHTLTPGFGYSSAEMVELDGRIRETLGRDSLSISMPRFGIRTVRFRL